MKLDTKKPLHIQAPELAKKHKLTHVQHEEWNKLIKSAYIEGSNANFEILKPSLEKLKSFLK